MQLLLLIALGPAIALAVYIYRKDAVEHEPVNLLLRLAGFGALSCIPAAIAEMAIGSVIHSFVPQESYLGAFLDAFVVAALCEECCKFFFLNRQTWRSPAFDYQFDGIVYAVTVSLGFAALENVEYVLQYGLGTGLLRAVTSVPGHAVFGVFMGYYYGFAKLAQYEGDRNREQYYKKLAVIVPLLLHGTYDFFAMTMQFDGRFTVLFFAFLAALYLVGTRQVNRSAMADRRVDEDVLQRFNPDFRPPWQE